MSRIPYAMPKPERPPFAMRVPLGDGQWIEIQSNRPMTPEAWRRFNLHLDLQHDIWAENKPAQADRNPEGHDPVEGHGRNDEGPAAATGGDAPNSDHSSPSPWRCGMTTLVDRLHALADRQRRERGDVMYLGEHDPEISEAASTIESLSERIAVLEGVGNALIAKLDECEPHITNAFAMEVLPRPTIQRAAIQG